MGVLNRPAIKYEARNFISIDTRWLKMFFAGFIIYILSNGFSIFVNLKNAFSNGFVFYDDYYSRAGDASTYGLTSGNFIIGLILMPFTVALAGYYLNHIRGFNPGWKSLYKEGIDNFGKYIATMIVREIYVFLWSLLFIIPGVIKHYAYSQTKYIIHDNNNLKTSDAIKMSDIMTKGFKFDLFVLDLSFILWYVLVACTAGIAIIYVTPYVETTRAMYYENLKKHAIDSGLITPESFGIAPVEPERGFNGDPMQNGGFTYGGEGIDAQFTVEDEKAPEAENKNNEENL